MLVLHAGSSESECVVNLLHLLQVILFCHGYNLLKNDTIQYEC